MQQKGWGTSFVEATQITALLDLFLEVTVVHSSLQRTPCCHSEQQSALLTCFERQQGDRLERPLNRTECDYALVEAKFIVAYK